ncbi:MAG: hypothetical protein MI924_12265 [Chloroflexales bacterium]|nr:hypothetical protein [Chloroflexales bacterium]
MKLEGYRVVRHQSEPGANLRYDIIATKDRKRIAVEVKARSHLRNSAGLIRELREHATRQGYDEFRLVVVNPPREQTIEIDNFVSILYEYMVHVSFSKLQNLAVRSFIENVSDIEIDSIEVNVDGVHVCGTGLTSVLLEYGDDNINNSRLALRSTTICRL